MICPECNGNGEAIYYEYLGTDFAKNTVNIKPKKDICRTCNGSGRMTQTNADRIRAMSDEELANFMADRSVNESTLLRLNENHGLSAVQIEAIKHNVYCACMQWLKQPAEE